jgi:hypothetical protein
MQRIAEGDTLCGEDLLFSAKLVKVASFNALQLDADCIVKSFIFSANFAKVASVGRFHSESDLFVKDLLFSAQLVTAASVGELQLDTECIVNDLICMADFAKVASFGALQLETDLFVKNLLFSAQLVTVASFGELHVAMGRMAKDLICIAYFAKDLIHVIRFKSVEALVGGAYNSTTVNDQVGWLGAAWLGVVCAWCGWRFSVEGPAGRGMARRGAANVPFVGESCFDPSHAEPGLEVPC